PKHSIPSYDAVILISPKRAKDIAIRRALTPLIGSISVEHMREANFMGPAPEFTGISTWLNSSPLTVADLQGHVVLVQFWTYTCINWMRTLPYVTKWYETYKDKSFIVIGVHTPEFPFEKETNNVEQAIKRFGIAYPVAQDNRFSTWKAYQNYAWPAEYLVDKSGKIVLIQFGEGNYGKIEKAIARLVGG